MSRPARRRTRPSCSAGVAGRDDRSRPDRATGTSRRSLVARLAAGLEPGVRVAGVVHHQVEDDLQAAPVGFLDEPVEVRLAAETRIDMVVVADVVADVQPGTRVDRRQPQPVDVQTRRPEMVEVADDPWQVAGAVAVGVGEAARVDLVDHALPPPVSPVAVARPRIEGGTEPAEPVTTRQALLRRPPGPALGGPADRSSGSARSRTRRLLREG